MIKTNSEVGKAEDEEFAFVKVIDGGKGLDFDRVVPGFCSIIELAPAVYSLPTRGAAARNGSLAFAVFLCEPESNPKLGPVCG